MRYLIFPVTVLLILACSEKSQNIKSQPIQFWYNTNYHPGDPDTLSMWELKWRLPDPEDSLIASDLLRVKDNFYYVMIYTNEFSFPPPDGESREIYVYGFGSVYYHALTWRNFGVLHSNNDSINELISLFVAKGLQLTTERESFLKRPRDPAYEKRFFMVPKELR